MISFTRLAAQPWADAAALERLSELVSIEAQGSNLYLKMPLVYPSGAGVVVRVAQAPGGYVVSDVASGYREAELVGAERSYAAIIRRICDESQIEYDSGHSLSVKASLRQLSGAVKLVSSATHRAAFRAFDSIKEQNAEQIAAELYNRLVRLFGMDKVFAHADVVGASSVNWSVSARVTIGSKDVIFDVVTPHHSSVFSAVSKFNDLSRRDNEPVEVAVVDDKNDMGKWLPLLSQVATVIDDEASDETLQKLVLAA